MTRLDGEPTLPPDSSYRVVPMIPLEITPQELLARLREHRTLKGVPDHELEWLIAHGTKAVRLIGGPGALTDSVARAMRC